MRSALLVILATSACASTSNLSSDGDFPQAVRSSHGRSVLASYEQPRLARMPPPEDTSEAQAYLSGALAALRAGQADQASVLLDAILKSDHLSDRGRANVYWLAADSHRLANHTADYLSCLAGFLVATDVLSSNGSAADADMRGREVEARAALVAYKVKTHPLLGKSPDDAIAVEDARDPSTIVAELGCGRKGRYVEDTVATHGAEERRLEARRLICTEGGAPTVLWFDVTHLR